MEEGKKRYMPQDYYGRLIEATKVQYREKFEQGFEWETNADQDMLSATLQKLELKGLETFVGDVAFDVSGNRLEGSVAVLKRKKAKE